MNIVFDIETYPNYVLFSFKSLTNNKIVQISSFEDEPLYTHRLKRIITNPNHTLIGFNSRNFDLPITFAAIQGASKKTIISMANYIIKERSPAFKTIDYYNIVEQTCQHIDIQEVAAGVGVSLKLYAARLHAKKLQELPYLPNTTLTKEQADNVAKYCVNDLDCTGLLFNKLKPDIELRKSMSQHYGIDLRSKSGAQIAKLVTKRIIEEKGHYISSRTHKVPAYVTYTSPDYINFNSDELNNRLNLVNNLKFELSPSGTIILPKTLTQPIIIGKANYKMGLGGLHSQEKAQNIKPLPSQELGEYDVVSMYPNLMVNIQISPKGLPVPLYNIIKPMLAKRIKAKREGNKMLSDSLKLVLNSTFGLLGNRYNHLYSPADLLRVTLTGQLFLLMCIERLELNGIRVLSANTDGIVVLNDKSKHNTVISILSGYEALSGLSFEYTKYEEMASQSVNNYITVLSSSGIKTKGSFNQSTITTNPKANIIANSIAEAFKYGYLPKDIINACNDITNFVIVRSVNGGATYKGKYLGKVVRFYYSTTSDEPIRYKSNGNKVPKSDNSKPIMQLPEKKYEIPEDLDRERYIIEAYKLLIEAGVKQWNYF